MNPKISLFLGLAAMSVALGTAIANANHVFDGHVQWMYFCYGGAILLVLLAVTLVFVPAPTSRPHIVATRWGQVTTKTAVDPSGELMSEWGLGIANDGDPAYEVGVYGNSGVKFGDFRLHLSNRIARFTRQDSEAYIPAWIDSKKFGGALGSGLFEIMRQHDIDAVHIPVHYKDGRNLWYKTVCTVERDVVHTRKGLIVKSNFRGRAFRPRD
jgi:hypothetical protein